MLISSLRARSLKANEVHERMGRNRGLDRLRSLFDLELHR
jgi:hypothetical protein